MLVDDWPERAEVLALLDRDPELTVPAVGKRYSWLVERPEVMADPSMAPASDRWVPEDPALGRQLVELFREAGRQGVVGAVWDWIARNRAWNFAPREIGVPAFLWHGELDENIPIAHFEYLARAIPGSHATVWKGDGHLALLHGPHWGNVLSTLVE